MFKHKILFVFVIVCSFFTTGCDVEEIQNVITSISQAVTQAVPAVAGAIESIQNAFSGVGRTAAAGQTTPTATVPTTTAQTAENDRVVDTASTRINATDREELGQTPTSIDAQRAEARLENYSGGRLSPQEFVSLFGPIARASMSRTGVPASIILAQAALETGWGSSSIGDAKNLFGIKGRGPAGSIRVPTHEVVNGRRVRIMDDFRKYNSWQESFEDHGRLLSQNPRYANAMRHRNDPDRFAQELQRAGYATDPQYASKLISIMRSNDLYRFNN